MGAGNGNQRLGSFFVDPGHFDQPVAVLKHCHDRIRKQLKTMDMLASPAVLAATPDEVRQAARQVLDTAPARFILAADCTVPGDTSWDNLKAAVDTAHGR